MRGQHVAQGLDLREVETVVEEGAAGEFAGFGVAGGYGGWAARDCLQDGAGDCWATMNVEFEDVFAGCSVGAWEEEDESVGVEDAVLAWFGEGVVEGADGGIAGFGERFGGTEGVVYLVIVFVRFGGV